MAYSKNIESEAVKSYINRNKTIKLTVYGFCIAAAFALIINYIANGTYYYLLIPLFAIAALTYLLNISSFFDKTWDGLIIDKQKQYTNAKTIKMVLKHHEHPLDKEGHKIAYIRTILSVQRDDGKIIKYIDVDDDESARLCYFNRGEKVRHHKGFKLLEKEDKSHDRYVICQFCQKLVLKENDNCDKCGMILFK